MRREQFSVEEFAMIAQKYSKEDIVISNHYLETLEKGKREISSETIKEYISSKNPFLVEKQSIGDEIRFKVIYKMSSKYDLIVVAMEKIPKSLKVITSYKSSKRIKKLWQKKAKLAMKK